MNGSREREQPFLAPERQRKAPQDDERAQESCQTQNTYFTSILLTASRPRPLRR